MSTPKKIGLALVALALVAAGCVITFGQVSAPKAGATNQVGYLQQLASWFTNTVYFGTSQQTSVDGSGNVTTSGTINATTLISGLFTQGGGVTATSTTAAVGTLQSADIDTENVIDFTVNQADVTLTLAASTTPICPATTGQTRTIFVRNASTTATADITIAGGTGVLLKKATTTATIYGDTDGGNFARIDITKKSNTDCEALLSIFMD